MSIAARVLELAWTTGVIYVLSRLFVARARVEIVSYSRKISYRPPAWSSPRWLGSVNLARKVTDLCCCTNAVAAVRPLRAATTWLDDARQASSNHLLASRKVERGRD